MTNGDYSSSFGALLKAFRIRRRLTQQQLATTVGMHRRAIGRWEQGDFLPKSKTMVLEVAKHLQLDDQETRQLLEASLTALTPHWLVPLPRNSFFTGRKEVLNALHAQLGIEQVVALTQAYALNGLGGIGKTQIALEYAYRYALEYSAIFWIEAETSETLVSSVLRIAELLQLPECQGADQQRTLAAVQRWLGTHNGWLLIWDNLEELELLHRFLPGSRQGAILLTTRCQALGPLAWGIDLPPMEHEEGILFVLRRAKVLEQEASQEQLQQFVKRMPGEYAAAATLVKAMGGLPLALDQAAAYIEETGCSPSDYVQRYQQVRASLLDRRGIISGNHPHSVTTTFFLASERVKQKHRAAADLLSACAFLHPEAIPEELLGASAVHLGPELEAFATNPSHFDLAIAALRSVSLVQRQPETHTFSMHRLVQAVLQASMNEQEQTVWLQRVTAALNAAFPEVTHEVWEQCERLLPHVLSCASAISEGAGDRALGKVLQKAADYLHNRAQYDQAEALYQRALCIQEQVLQAEYPDLVDSLTGLGFLYTEQRAYERAEPLYQKALHILERRLGPEDPALASIFHKLASLYNEQGKDERAEMFFKQALHILEQASEADRQKMANSLNGLAGLYFKQEKYEQAEPLYQQALSIWEQALGLEHPLLPYALNGLASIRSEQKKYEQAELLYQRALFIWEQALGPEHPNVAYILANQAQCYTQQRKYEQAELAHRRTLSIWEQVFGSEHPNIAHMLTQQAGCYTLQGNFEQAEPLFRRALQIRQRHLGQSHPEIAQTLYDLAFCREKQGHLSEALSLAEHALRIFGQELGEDHLKTSATRTLHTRLVQAHTCTEEGAGSLQETSQSTSCTKSIAIRGATRQVAYTRNVRMREVTFTCTICGQIVTQMHYPSGRIKYCSEACRAVRSVQIQEERVRKQREKRRTEREAHLRALQEENL